MSQVLDPPVVHPVPAALAVLDGALDTAGDAQLWQLCDDEVMDAVAQVHRLQCRAEALKLRLVREVDARGAAVAAGATSTKAWLGSRLRLHPGAAKRTVVAAAALHADPAGPLVPAEDASDAGDSTGGGSGRGMAACRTALAAGAISGEHVSVVLDALGALPASVDTATIARGEAHLAGLAREFDPAQLAKLGKHLLHTLDPDCGDRLAETEQALVHRRELMVIPRREGGYTIKGQLDTELGATLLTALSAYAAPRPHGTDATDATDHAGQPDPRTPARRNADALADDLLALATSHPDVATVHDSKPTVVVTVDHATLTRGLGALGGSLDWDGPLSGEAARRLACDARIIPVVLGAHGEPLDVGRASYSVPTAIRRALTVRDRGCAFPGCQRPPGWCHAHHIQHWVHGGHTSLANTMLVCPAHHRGVHHDGWTVRISANGLPEFLPPRWIDPAQTPRTRRWRAELAALPSQRPLDD